MDKKSKKSSKKEAPVSEDEVKEEKSRAWPKADN
jgi:hypothetical protein